MVVKGSGTSRKRLKACPKCGSADVVPILYGYPTPAHFADAAKGTIALGGCCIFGNDPRKLCRACGEEFDRPRASARKPRECSTNGAQPL